MDNRENIMRCALNLFADKGYDAVGVQEIVTAAQITKPTLYYYFKSKQGLLESLIQEKGEPFINSIVQVVNINEDIKAKLFYLAKTYVRFAAEEEKFFLLMLCLNYYPKQNDAHKAIVPLITRYYHLVTEVFERASGSLGNMNGRQEQFAMGFIGTLNCYITVQYERGTNLEQIRDEGAIYRVVHQFLHGIFS